MSEIVGTMIMGSLAGLCFGMEHQSKKFLTSSGEVSMPITCMVIGGFVGLVIGSYPQTFPLVGYMLFGGVRDIIELPPNGIIQTFDILPK